MKNKSYILSLLVTFLILLTACGGGSSFDQTDELKDAKNGAFISAKELSIKQPRVGIYKVKGYRLVYVTTDNSGKKLKASGLLLIPQKDSSKKSPLFSYQHGTHFLDSQVPSNNPSEIPEIAGRGFIVSAPDYIGYGESASHPHTYIHAKSYANAVIDMLRATKAFLKTINITLNEQLFLAGYSEGGYATLAAQRAIQENYSNEFNVTASAPGAGPYDLSGTARIIFNQDENANPAFMSFVIKTYNDIYNLNAIDEMYQQPYVNPMNTVFDGKHSGLTIRKALNDVTSQLFKPVFLATVQGASQHALTDKLAENNIYDWTPTVPTRFFHSKYDETVPYENTRKLIQEMNDNGAQNIEESNCSILIQKSAHVYCVPLYLEDTIKFFLKHDPEL
ncbi:MAG TPA: hypothetical protein EYG71_06825 [Leucothrix sp.]|nr:hypothetical protein [Leucothrix sp.]